MRRQRYYYENTDNDYHYYDFGINVNFVRMIAYSESYIEGENAAVTSWSQSLRTELRLMGLCLIGFLLCLIYLIWTAGRKKTDEETPRRLLDLWYGEFVLGLFLLAVFLEFGNVFLFFYRHWRPPLYVPAAVFALIHAAGLASFLSIVCRIKNKALLRHTLLYAVLSRTLHWVQTAAAAGPLLHKTVGVVLLVGLITMIPYAGLITVPLALWLTVRQVRRYNQIQNGVLAVQGGNYAERIETDSRGEFKILAEALNRIQSGLSDEVERRLRAERLKTDLITNVSHDIRTPLTSIITYIGLLQAEETDNENIKRYIAVVAQKAKRLKTLTDDLFEASKAVSDNIPVTLERVDLSALLAQGLGELDDQITASSLEFKLSLPEEKLYVRADGNLLWRVVENLLSNVFKYALAGSRVYISVCRRNQSGVGVVEIKNISAVELNIEEAELMERFKRGDESRSSQGSGLGLAIAQSLTLAQQGTLEIKIDGDLFKATISLPEYVYNHRQEQAGGKRDISSSAPETTDSQITPAAPPSFTPESEPSPVPPRQEACE